MVPGLPTHARALTLSVPPSRSSVERLCNPTQQPCCGYNTALSSTYLLSFLIGSQ